MVMVGLRFLQVVMNKILIFTLAVFMSSQSLQVSDIHKPRVLEKGANIMTIQEYINYCNNVITGIASELQGYEQCTLSRSFWKFKSTHLYMMLLYMQSLDQHAQYDKEWQTARTKFQAWLIYIRAGKGDEYNGWNIRQLNEKFQDLKNAYRHHKHRLRYWEYMTQGARLLINEQKILEAA